MGLPKGLTALPRGLTPIDSELPAGLTALPPGLTPIDGGPSNIPDHSPIMALPQPGGKIALISTYDASGKPLSDDEAQQQYWDSGQHLGLFSTPEEATSAANQIISRRGPELQRTSAQTPYERAVATDKTRVEAENLAAREARGIGAGRQMVEKGALSILSGGVGLAEIPGQLARGQAALTRKAVRAVGGEKAAETFSKIQPYIPASLGGSLGVEAVQGKLESARKTLQEAGPESLSPIIKDPETGEEFLNLEAAKDPKFWIGVVGEEAAPMAVQVLLAKMSGGASAAANPSLIAKLEKAGKVGKLALKFLGSGAAQKLAGFGAARAFSETQKDAIEKLMAKGKTREQAEEDAAFAAGISAPIQGLVEGNLDKLWIGKALNEKAVGFLKKAGGYIGAFATNASEEGLQKAVDLAVAKVTYDPTITLKQALNEVLVESAAGGVIGAGVRGATRFARNAQVEPSVEPEVIQAPEPTAFREATPEEVARVGKYDKLELSPEDEIALQEALKPAEGDQIQRQYPDVPAPSAGEARAKMVLRLQDVNGQIDTLEAKYKKTRSRKLKAELDLLTQEASELSDAINIFQAEPEPVSEIVPAKTSDVLSASQIEQEDIVTQLRNNRVELQNELDQANAEAETLRIQGKRGKSEAWQEANARIARITAEMVANDEELMLNTGKTYNELQGEPSGVAPKDMNALAPGSNLDWQNTRTAWEALKTELAKPGNERGAIGEQTNPEVFARSLDLVQAAISDGYKNASEWLADLRNRMPDFREFYQRIGGLAGAERLWGMVPSGSLTPGMSGTETLSNEELKRQQRGDTYYRVDRSGTVTRLGYQPDAPVRAGEAILMVNGLTGKTQVQNSEGLGNDQAVLGRFGSKVETAHKEAVKRFRQIGAVGKDISQVMRRGVAEALPGPDKKEARHEAYKQIGQVIAPPTTEESIQVAGRMKILPSETNIDPETLNIITNNPRREYHPAMHYLMSPAITAMRDKAFQFFNNATRRFVATGENILYSFGETTAQFNDLDAKQQENLSAALMYGTTANENKGRVWSDAELSKYFPGMDTQTRSVYKNIVKHIKDTTDRLIKAETARHESMKRDAEKLIAEASSDRAKVMRKNLKETDAAFKDYIANLSNEAYFPLKRFGKYKIELFDGENKRLGMALINKPDDAAEIRAAVNRMAAQDPAVRRAIQSGNYTQTEPVKMPELDYAGPGIPEPALLRYITAAKDIDPKLMSEIELAAMQAYMTGNWKEHLQHRTGLPGYDMDGLKIYKHYAHTVANRIANLEHGENLDKALEGMGAKARGKAYDSDLEKAAKQVLDSVRNPPYIPVANAITTLAFISDLGLKFNFVLQNLIQQGSMGLPVMSNFYGVSKTLDAIQTGNRVAAKFLRLEQIGGIESYTPEQLEQRINLYIQPSMFKDTKDPQMSARVVRAVLLAAAKDGELRPKVSNDLMAKRDTTVSSKYEELLSGVAEFAGYFASKSEQQNRIATIVAVAKLAVEKGIVNMDENGWTLNPINKLSSDGQTIEDENGQAISIRNFAEQMNAIINFSAGKGNMSWYQRQKGGLGGLLKVSSQYKRFMIDQITSLNNLGVINKRALKDKNWIKANYGRIKPILMNSMVMLVFGGAKSVIPIAILLPILKTILRDRYKEFMDELVERAQGSYAELGTKMGLSDENAERFGKKLAFSAANGISNMLPDDYAFNLNPALEPMLLMGPDGESLYAMAGRLVAGSTGGKAINALGDLNEFGYDSISGWTKAAGKFFVPSAAKGVIQAATGKYQVSKRGEDRYHKLSPAQRLMRLGSVMPSEVSRIQDVTTSKFEAYKIKRDFINPRKKLYQEALDPELTDAERDKRIDRLRDEVIKFNERYEDKPEMRINWRRDIVGSRRGQSLDEAYEISGVER